MPNEKPKIQHLNLLMRFFDALGHTAEVAYTHKTRRTGQRGAPKGGKAYLTVKDASGARLVGVWRLASGALNYGYARTPANYVVILPTEFILSGRKAKAQLNLAEAKRTAHYVRGSKICEHWKHAERMSNTADVESNDDFVARLLAQRTSA